MVKKKEEDHMIEMEKKRVVKTEKIRKKEDGETNFPIKKKAGKRKKKE